jgi:hypothetical protein
MSDARWVDPREYDVRNRSDDSPRVYDPRDRDEHDPRDGLMHDLDLPRGDERELVVDRDRVYELDGEDSRTLAAVGAFRVVPEHDLDLPRDTLDNLHDQRLVATVELGDGERGLTLTIDGRDLLHSHSQERDAEPSQVFYAGEPRCPLHLRCAAVPSQGSTTSVQALLAKYPDLHEWPSELRPRVGGIPDDAQVDIRTSRRLTQTR